MKRNKEGFKSFHLLRWIAVITMIAMLLSGCKSSETEKTKNQNEQQKHQPHAWIILQKKPEDKYQTT